MVQDVFGAVNLFTNSSGDESWANSANWSLGVIPNATHDVTVTLGQLLRIPNGTNAVANSIYLSGDNEMIITAAASLEVVDHIYIFDGAKLTNRGNLDLLPGCEGFKVAVGGILLNNDTIHIMSPEKGINFTEGTITNNELITIDGALHYGIYMPLTANSPNQRVLYNNAGATISITNTNGNGIFLSDTISNAGSILINNIDRDVPTVPAEGIYIFSFGKLFNSGYIDISDSEDYCLHNYSGVFKNEAAGTIDLSAFQDIGYLNEFISDNYGELNINCTITTPGNRGIHLLNVMTNRAGGQINITGNNHLEIAIEVDYTFNNEAGAEIHIDTYLDTGMKVDAGGFSNYGMVTIGEVVDLLGYGIEAFSYVNNYGTITFENMGSGIRNVTSSFNNHGNLTFHNLISKAIFSEQKLTNHTDGNILIYNDDGSRISWGIIHVDEVAGGEFFNNGNIIMDSVHVGIDLRIGDFINNGLLFINHYRYGIDFGTFYDPAVFSNYGDVQIQNQEEPLAYTVYVEGGDPGTQNFLNKPSGTIEILNAYRGFLITTGLKNEGIIEMTNITERAFYLNNTTNAFECINSSTGAIQIDNAQYGVYFGSGGANNLNSFVNDGSIKFLAMQDYGITGENTSGLFENNGEVRGNAEINCTYFLLENDIHPGNKIGAMSFDNYQASSPTFHIQLKGNAGPGNPNGHDVLLATSDITLSAHLVVDTLPGFVPQLGNEYSILFSSGTITGTFLSTIYPDFGPNLTFNVSYLSDRIKLVIVPKYTYWFGTVNSNWNNANNWSGLAVPDENSFVIIIGAVPHYPILNASTLSIGSNTGGFKCKSLEITTGALLTLVNTSVEVHGDVNVSGVFDYHTSSAHQVHLYSDGRWEIAPGGDMSLHQF